MSRAAERDATCPRCRWSHPVFAPCIEPPRSNVSARVQHAIREELARELTTADRLSADRGVLRMVLERLELGVSRVNAATSDTERAEALRLLGGLAFGLHAELAGRVP